MATRRISSLVITTVLPRQLIPPTFYRSKIYNLLTFSPSSPNLVHSRPFSIKPELYTLKNFPGLKEAKETLLQKIREDGVPFQIVDDDNDKTVLQREYGGDIINIVVDLHEVRRYSWPDYWFTVNVVKGDGATLRFKCKLDNLEKLKIVSVYVLKAGEQEDYKNKQLFNELHEDLQNGFLEYLDKRGIKTDLVELLRDYRKSVLDT